MRRNVKKALYEIHAFDLLASNFVNLSLQIIYDLRRNLVAQDFEKVDALVSGDLLVGC